MPLALHSSVYKQALKAVYQSVSMALEVFSFRCEGTNFSKTLEGDPLIIPWMVLSGNSEGS